MKTGWMTGPIGLAAWTSVLALCAWPHSASAACVPVPPADNDIVVCTGGSDGFSTPANNITVDVQSGGLTPVGDVAFEFTGNDITFINSIFLGGSVLFQSDGVIDILNEATGEIQSGGGNVVISTQGSQELTLINNGTLRAQGTGAIGIEAIQTDIGGGAFADTITNAGTIAGHGTSVTGVLIEGDDTEFINSGTILITDASSTAVHATAPGGAVTGLFLHNTATGEITANFGSDAVFLFGLAEFLNNGSITAGVAGFPGGAIIGDSGVQTVTNNGIIDGTLNLGGGNDTLFVGTGASFTGIVAGGADTDGLFINNTDEIEIPDLSGFETLEKDGNGSVTILSSFGLEDVDVLDGDLTMSGDVANDVNVSAGASFSTNGDIGNDAIINGTINVLPSVAGLEIGNDLTLFGTSTFGAGFSDDAQSLVDVIGTADLAGDFILVPVDQPVFDFSFDVITAGTLLNTFDSENDIPNYVYSLIYGADTVTVDGELELGANLMLSPEAQEVADFLQMFIDDGTATDGTIGLIKSLLMLSPADFEAALLTLLTPTVYSAFSTLAVDQSLTIADIVRDRANAKMGERGPFYAWASPFGSFQKSDATTFGGAGYRDTNLRGILAGGGVNMNEKASFGFFIGTSQVEQDFALIDAYTEGDSHIFGAYIAASAGPLRLTFLGGYDQSDLKTSREIDTLDETAEADYAVNTTFGGVAASGVFGRRHWIAVEPRVQATYIVAERDAITETGSDSSIFVGEQRFDALYLDAGVKIMPGAASGLHEAIKPYVIAGYRQNLLNNEEELVPTGLTSQDAFFSSPGVKPDETQVYGGLGVLVRFTPAVTADVEYKTEFGEMSTRHIFTGGVVMRFGGGIRND